MAFGHSFGPSGLLDIVFHALRALKRCFVACEGRWVKNVTEEEFRSIGLGFTLFCREFVGANIFGHFLYLCYFNRFFHLWIITINDDRDNVIDLSGNGKIAILSGSLTLLCLLSRMGEDYIVELPHTGLFRFKMSMLCVSP